MSGILDWFKRAYKAEVVDTLLGKGTDVPSPPGRNTAVAAAPSPERNVKVTAKIPPVATYGSYALHKGIDVSIKPPPGERISAIAAEEWLAFQDDYYQSNVVTGDLATSSGATLAQFMMRNVTVRDDGFSFRFQEGKHPAGMPFAQLATFIEIQKQVPIIAVDTNHLEAVVREELENQ
jgi:hypothetical protein